MTYDIGGMKLELYARKSSRGGRMRRRETRPELSCLGYSGEGSGSHAYKNTTGNYKPDGEKWKRKMKRLG
jgi:hypothetical protein